MAKIYAPNERYAGVTAGVSFSNGVGETEDKWAIQWFKYKGYKVEDEPEENPNAGAEEEIETAQTEAQDERGKHIDLEIMTVPELKELAKEQNVSGYGRMKKDELIKALKKG